MRVVLSDPCPMDSLMTDNGTFMLLAMLAHPWRAQYVVNLIGHPTICPISFKWLFTRCKPFRYCRRSSHPGLLIIGSK